MKIAIEDTSRQARSVGEPATCAFAAHTNADHAHHTSASTSIARPNPRQVRSRHSSVVTCVIANTNTRSHSSSTGLDRRSSAVSGGVSYAISSTRGVSRWLGASPAVTRREPGSHSLVRSMKLGAYLGYWLPGQEPADQLAFAVEAERLGYDSVWAAEAYGSDAATVLAWLAAGTSKIKLGSAIFQMPARSAAMTAMTAATIDNISGGRMVLGIGSSRPPGGGGGHAAGGGGVAGAAVRAPVATDPRVRRGAAARARARAGRVPRRDARAAAARRP